MQMLYKAEGNSKEIRCLDFWDHHLHNVDTLALLEELSLHVVAYQED